MKIPKPIVRILQILPEAPPAFAVVTALNLVRGQLWPEEDFAWLEGKTVRLEAVDIGCGLSYTFTAGKFMASQKAPDVTFRACLADYWVIARRQEDPDTLFFQRRLTIEGDTELGLTLKNLMDATDFELLFAHIPAPLRTRLSF
ncbi:SCP2 sterol-binding domain-containing protein [Chitinibacter bivalviorum]|uniref:Ubiquinone biosynthesis accessory factor UbiT n=1 Tax=Chitinibacter bivalviorum TaxID=2739434 RepID=A0A7H9BPR5_9NEIS|nr:SCP2 sterol-binding domain-containing protein [Chitinibacter bivalviorum]QLG89344.1 SCP2 sterol-binding domain-containing protein [Chitinibacter bivalviorum]